jgi:RNA polymerase sigma-70 factor (ECF subfamily)
MRFGLTLSLTSTWRETVRMATQGPMTLDRATFSPMTEPYRRDLLLHCYRFTGSLTDAEDLVQETLARAWRGRASYRGDAGLRTWLRRIATRTCLDALRRTRRRRTLPSALGADEVAEVLWLEPMPDDLIADADTDPAATYEARESVSLAFLVALQHLSPRQRAVLILRDVLALQASEVAEHLEISLSAVNSLLHRARRTMQSRYDRPATSAIGDPGLSVLLRRYLRAWEAGDVDALLATLKADATLEMPPIPSAFIGHAAIRGFLAESVLDGARGRWRGMTTEANGGPAVALYALDGDAYAFTGIQILRVVDGAIASVTAYMDAALAGRFRLPQKLDD